MKFIFQGALVIALLFGVVSQATEKPLSAAQVKGLVTGGVNSRRVAMLIDQRGIDFEPTTAFVNALQKAGADEALLKALRSAKRISVPASNRTGQSPAAPQTVTAEAPPAKAPSVVPATHDDPTTQQVPDRDSANGAAPGAPEPPGAAAATKSAPAAVSSPAEAEAHDLVLAVRLGEKKQWPEAEKQYRSVLAADPQNPTVYLALGHVLAEQNKWDEAISEYHEAVRLNPDDADAHRSLAVAFEEKHDTDGAIGEYRALLRLNPDDADLDSRLGQALYTKGDLNAAIAAYRAAASLRPEDPQGHNRLGLALYLSGAIDQAIVEYREALGLKSDYIEAHENLGDALLRKGDREGALEQYRLAFDLAPNDSSFRATYQQLQQQLKH